MNGWYPRISQGGQVASGYGSVWIDGRQVAAQGFTPQWMGENDLVYKGQDDKLYVTDGTTSRLLFDIPVLRFAAGRGLFIPITPGGELIDASVDVALGHRAELLELGGQNTNRSLNYNNLRIVSGEPIAEPRAADGLVCWSLYTGMHDRGPWGMRLGGQPENLRRFLHGWEGNPVPFMTPEGPWLLTMTNWDLRLAPWGSKEGYIVKTGEDGNLNPDARFVGAEILVVCSNGAGTLLSTRIHLSAPRTDISVAAVPDSPPPPSLCATKYAPGSFGSCPICGHAKSIHQVLVEPQEPVMSMEMPQAVYDTYVKCVEKFPHSGSDDDRRAANRKAIETIRAKHGLRWVAKSEHNTGWAAASKDALACVEEEPVHGQKMDMFIWDMINGTTRQPVPRHESEPKRKAFALVPDTKDWLEDGEPQEPQEPEEPGEIETLRRLVAGLIEEMGALQARVKELEDRPPSSGSIDMVARESLAKLIIRLKGHTQGAKEILRTHSHKILGDGETF
jgi:hypothetical protein